MKCLLTVILIGAALSGAIAEDKIVLKSGKQVKATVVEFNDDILTIRIADGRLKKVRISKIKQIVFGLDKQQHPPGKVRSKGTLPDPEPLYEKYHDKIALIDGKYVDIRLSKLTRSEVGATSPKEGSEFRLAPNGCKVLQIINNEEAIILRPGKKGRVYGGARTGAASVHTRFQEAALSVPELLFHVKGLDTTELIDGSRFTGELVYRKPYRFVNSRGTKSTIQSFSIYKPLTKKQFAQAIKEISLNPNDEQVLRSIHSLIRTMPKDIWPKPGAAWKNTHFVAANHWLRKASDGKRLSIGVEFRGANEQSTRYIIVHAEFDGDFELNRNKFEFDPIIARFKPEWGGKVGNLTKGETVEKVITTRRNKYGRVKPDKVITSHKKGSQIKILGTISYLYLHQGTQAKNGSSSIIIRASLYGCSLQGR